MRDLSDWLDTIVAMHPKAIDMGLARIQAVAEKADLSQFNIPVITIAGTNGKGSCVATLASILHAAGYRVGAYTSPHLLTFNERIRVDMQPVDDQRLCDAFTRIDKLREQTSLTFFEFTTLAALDIFQTAKLDVILLEVGLGGRLDAVNIVDPSIAVITTIDFDHCDYLGNTLSAIGGEKAGIFREKIPAICADEQAPEIISQRAAALHCPFYQLGHDFFLTAKDNLGSFKTRDIELQQLPLPNLPMPSVAAALMVIELLQERLPVALTSIAQGLARAELLGRYTRLPGAVPMILDVAHNPQSARLLAQRLQAEPNSGKTLAIFSMLSDKDHAATIAPLASVIDEWYIAPLDVHRASSVAQLSPHLAGLAYHTFDNIPSAVRAAQAVAKIGDRIVVFGSFFTVAKALEIRV